MRRYIYIMRYDVLLTLILSKMTRADQILQISFKLDDRSMFIQLFGRTCPQIQNRWDQRFKIWEVFVMAIFLRMHAALREWLWVFCCGRLLHLLSFWFHISSVFESRDLEPLSQKLIGCFDRSIIPLSSHFPFFWLFPVFLILDFHFSTLK